MSKLSEAEVMYYSILWLIENGPKDQDGWVKCNKKTFERLHLIPPGLLEFRDGLYVRVTYVGLRVFLDDE